MPVHSDWWIHGSFLLSYLSYVFLILCFTYLMFYLSFSDRCVLKDRKAVDNIHDKQFQIFQYVASKRHPDFYKWLPDVINFLTYLREFAIEFDKKSCNMNMEWPVIQRNPLLLEVFFS